MVLANIPTGATNNAHLFYLLCKNVEQRDSLILFLKQNGVQSMFHYPGLHTSPFYGDKNKIELANAEMFSNCLVRLPLFVELEDDKINTVVALINKFFE